MGTDLLNIQSAGSEKSQVQHTIQEGIVANRARVRLLEEFLRHSL